MSEKFNFESNIRKEPTEASETRIKLESMVEDPKNKKLLDLAYEIWLKQAA